MDKNDEAVAEDVWEHIQGGTVSLIPECMDSVELTFSVPMLGDFDLSKNPAQSCLNRTLRSDRVNPEVFNPRRRGGSR